MTSTAADTATDLVERPIWTGLMGADAEGAFLIGGTCAACGFTTLGVREICPDCWAEGTMREAPIGRRGTLYTFTVIHQLPQGYDEPFAVGYVDLADGIRVFSHIDNTPNSLVIGADLELASAHLRKDDDGAWLNGPVYRAHQAGET